MPGGQDQGHKKSFISKLRQGYGREAGAEGSELMVDSDHWDRQGRQSFSKIMRTITAPLGPQKSASL
jgi:hypothetical protein